MFVEQRQAPVLVAVCRDVHAASRERAQVVEREVDALRECALVVVDQLGEQLVEDLSTRRIGQAVLEQALHQHRVGRVVRMGRRIERAQLLVGWDVDVGSRGRDALEHALRKRTGVADGGQQELRLLRVERAPLEGRAACRAEASRDASPLERGRDDLAVLDEAVVERQQARVLRQSHLDTSAQRTIVYALVRWSSCRSNSPVVRAGTGERVAHVVVHHDRQHVQIFSNTATNEDAVASPSGESSSGRWNASASRL